MPRLADWHFLAILRPARMEGAFPVDPLISVGPEVVAQALHEVRREALAAIGVVVRER